MAVIAHEMDLTMGLLEIGKLCDYRSLPDTCWLESVQPKSMMGCDLRCGYNNLNRNLHDLEICGQTKVRSDFLIFIPYAF